MRSTIFSEDAIRTTPTFVVCLLSALLFQPEAVSARNAETALTVRKSGGVSYVSVYELAEQESLDQNFDPVMERGKLFSGRNTVIYQVGLSAVLCNGRIERSDHPVVRSREGEVFLPVDLASFILETMRGRKTVVRNSVLSFETGTAAAVVKPSVSDDHDVSIDFIVIDAGHGGKDPGAVGKGGAQEKTIVLSVARKLQTYLRQKLPGRNIVLTRSGDRFLELGERTEIANRMLKRRKNGIFISIHANATLSPKVNGYETYFLSRAPTSDDARVTAALENTAADLEKRGKKRYDDIEFVEALMLTAQIQKESGKLAELVQGSMGKKMRKTPNRGVKRADFFVLRGALMPAVLVEIGYITNDAERRLMQSASYQEVMVSAIGEGVVDFVTDYARIAASH
jgi:N-acetylmuramoyl-L-alanine amidase